MPRPDLLLPSIVLLPFAAAALALLLGRRAGGRTGILMVLAAAASFAQALALAVAGWGGAPPVSVTQPWIPSLGVGFALQGDPFGLFFALLVSGIGLLVGVYALAYMPDVGPSRLAQFYAALLAFMGSMLGIALAADLILLFVFWELTSITSFILIGFWYDQDEARHGALTALLVTALGGLAMLAGFLILGLSSGTFSLARLTASPDALARLADSGLLTPALVLILIGALTKSAQWPFHFWLPGAMVAPTPVSTYLHAATMVKAGVFLLGRLLPLFGDAAAWSAVLVPVGLFTFLLGAFQALREHDLKAILARTTVSALGLFTMIYGLRLPGQDALQILSHAAYKGPLFLVAGIVEHATHTRDLRRLGGLRRAMPLTFAVCLVAALSMAGLPPFLGFLAKEALYEALLHLGGAAGALVLGLAVLANAMLFAAVLRLAGGIFLGPPAATVEHAHEASPGLLLPPAVLAGVAAVLGLGAPLAEGLARGFSSAPGHPLHLSLVPAHPGPLLLSLATVALGLLILAGQRALQGPGRLPGMQAVWDRGLDVVVRAAVAFSARWQSGSVRWYFSGTLAFAAGLCILALYGTGLSVLQVPVSLAEMQWYGLALCAMLSASAVMVVRSTTRIGAAIALTSNGFLTALLFVVYRSPDILLTQILIESVSTLFILLVLYFMPPFRPDGFTAFGRLVNLAISLAVGVVMFVFILLATSPALRETRNLAADYLTRSLAEAGGANAVNVIIVDFRAIDTNGEITVLVLVALLVYGLLRARRAA